MFKCVKLRVIIKQYLYIWLLLFQTGRSRNGENPFDKAKVQLLYGTCAVVKVG